MLQGVRVRVPPGAPVISYKIKLKIMKRVLLYTLCFFIVFFAVFFIGNRFQKNRQVDVVPPVAELTFNKAIALDYEYMANRADTFEFYEVQAVLDDSAHVTDMLTYVQAGDTLCCFKRDEGYKDEHVTIELNGDSVYDGIAFDPTVVKPFAEVLETVKNASTATPNRVSLKCCGPDGDIVYIFSYSDGNIIMVNAVTGEITK